MYTKQCMVSGHVFGLASNEVEIVYSGHRLTPDYVRRLSLKEKDIISKAVDVLSTLTTKGISLKKAYSHIW